MVNAFGSTIDSLVRDVSARTSATPIEMRTERIGVPYPGSETVQLRLELPFGMLELNPGSDQLFNGTATFNVAEWSPRVVAYGPCITVKQDIDLRLLDSC